MPGNSILFHVFHRPFLGHFLMSCVSTSVSSGLWWVRIFP